MTETPLQTAQKAAEAVRLLPGTKAKLIAIQRRTRQSYGVIVDVAFDEYMAAHDISVPESEAPTT